MKICPAPGALYRTKEGAVAIDRDKCIGCKLCVAGCPFDVPRYDSSNKISKCNLCTDRVAEGLTPACAKTCPTGAIKFGDRNELIDGAKKAGYTKVYGEADLTGLGTLYAFKDTPKLYGMNENPAIPESVIFWHNVLKPLSVLGLGGVVAGALIHYAAIGPHKDDEEVKNHEANDKKSDHRGDRKPLGPGRELHSADHHGLRVRFQDRRASMHCSGAMRP